MDHQSRGHSITMAEAEEGESLRVANCADVLWPTDCDTGDSLEGEEGPSGMGRVDGGEGIRMDGDEMKMEVDAGQQLQVDGKGAGDGDRCKEANGTVSETLKGEDEVEEVQEEQRQMEEACQGRESEGIPAGDKSEGETRDGEEVSQQGEGATELASRNAAGATGTVVVPEGPWTNQPRAVLVAGAVPLVRPFAEAIDESATARDTGAHVKEALSSSPHGPVEVPEGQEDPRGHWGLQQE